MSAELLVGFIISVTLILTIANTINIRWLIKSVDALEMKEDMDE